MTTLLRILNDEPVEYRNSQYIPAFLFLPAEIMACEPIEFRSISRNVQKLLRDPKTIAQVESDVFLLGIILGYSLLVWPAMGQKCTPESYSQNDPATLLSRTPSYWITMLEDAGILLDAWEWLQVFRNVDGDFGIVHLAEIMPTIEALVPQTMAKYHMTETIQIARENPCHEDFGHTNSTQKRDFRRKWKHSRAGTAVLSLEDLQEEAEAAGKTLQWEPVDLEPAVEDSVLNRVVADQFLGMINETDREILRLRYLGFTLSEIAEKLGFKTHSAVQKRIQKLGWEYESFTETDLGFEEERLRKAERRKNFKS